MPRTEPDKPLTISEAARAVCPSRPVHAATVWRWILGGVRGRKLPSRLIGGRRFIEPGDLDAFLEALNRPGEAPGAPAPPAPPTARARRAAEKLRAMGC